MGGGVLCCGTLRASVRPMPTIHIVHHDAATRLAVRRVLQGAGFAVTDGADETTVGDGSPMLVIAERGGVAVIRRRMIAARILMLGGDEGLSPAFTPSQLLAAVRLTLARPVRSCATTEPRRRSTRPRRPPAGRRRRTR